MTAATHGPAPGVNHEADKEATKRRARAMDEVAEDSLVKDSNL